MRIIAENFSTVVNPASLIISVKDGLLGAGTLWALSQTSIFPLLPMVIQGASPTNFGLAFMAGSYIFDRLITELPERLPASLKKAASLTAFIAIASLILQGSVTLPLATSLLMFLGLKNLIDLATCQHEIDQSIKEFVNEQLTV